MSAGVRLRGVLESNTQAVDSLMLAAGIRCHYLTKWMHARSAGAQDCCPFDLAPAGQTVQVLAHGAPHARGAVELPARSGNGSRRPWSSLRSLRPSPCGRSR